jgi:phosphohistidine swiveling domain-containing protein
MTTLPLATRNNDLNTIGGKGRSLSRLSNSGFNVPDGFLVPTAAYRRFVADNDLQPRILNLCKPIIIEGAVSFEQASKKIQELFSLYELSSEIESDIIAAYESLPERPSVAVRSSANAEDLPELSFAGQQETYLNITGGPAVAAAIRNCWASLWTAQAINYRHEMDIGQDAVAMAVVVQLMVPSDVSGILFTANPTNGERSEMIVNGSFGLGEAVVSGQVTPDTYVVDRESLNIKDTIIGAKDQMIVSDGTQGVRVESVSAEQQVFSSLSEELLRELCKLALKVEAEFDEVPQDIEWAMVNKELYLLQSRPITNLPPEPLKDVSWPEISGAQLLKRQVAENMPDPLSPLFEELYLRAIFDMQKWPEGWEWKGNLTRNWLKNFVVITVNGYAYQPIYEASVGDWEGYMDKLHAEQKKSTWLDNLKRIFTMPSYIIDDMKGGPLHVLYLVGTTFRTFKKFPAIKLWERQQLPDYLAAIEHWERTDSRKASSEELLAGIKSLTFAEALYWSALRSIIGTAKMTDGALQTYLEENAPDQGFISGTFLSGFPSRTLDAEVTLRRIAEEIRKNKTLYEIVIVTPAPRMLTALQNHPEGKDTLVDIRKYLHDYGRQVFNLDFVEPSLEEEPLPFLMSLKAMVRNPGYDLVTRQQEVRKNRRSKFWQAIKFFKGKSRFEFLRLYLTARINYPTREEALFYMGLAWSSLRPLAKELGGRLVSNGTLTDPDDVFYLTSDDLQRAIDDNDGPPELKSKVKEQRELRALRFRMNQPAAIPPIETNVTENSFAALRGNSDDANKLLGFAVSPGIVSGIASVIMTPNDFDKMIPDSILVCPLTTPAWTQLFPHAIGLVTDIGSILAHGSIVAREYGIPAVLGIGDATQRIKNGQTITIDGNKGVVTVEE